MTIYNFTGREIQPLSTYEKTDYYIIHEKLSNGEELTKEEKVKAVFSSSSPFWKLMGYCYNCREFLNEYWIETEHYGIQICEVVWMPDLIIERDLTIPKKDK